jgi:alpha-galactosidase
MVIDDGWQEKYCYRGDYNGGPWKAGNSRFPDMNGLARLIKEAGARPGIWYRPLLTCESLNGELFLQTDRFGSLSQDRFLDPSHPDALDIIAADARRLSSWGYELIKYDFSTFDIFGRWGFEMNWQITSETWAFKDKAKTNAQIIKKLYETIYKAAGNALLIGCNTIGHLGAGFFHIQRTGDDTSGREWERTRKMGINTLSFRAPQHDTFFACDADCVGLTSKIPWILNKQWLSLLSKSGTPLFISAAPDAVGKEQEIAIREAFEIASRHQPVGEALDWMDTTCPVQWMLNGERLVFNWDDMEGKPA